MKPTKLSILLLLATGLLSVACESITTTAKNETPAVNSAPTPTKDNAAPKPVDAAPRISLADAKKAFDDGTAIFVDTRVESAYKQEHIKGAVNILVGSVAANASKLSKGKKIIAYCS